MSTIGRITRRISAIAVAVAVTALAGSPAHALDNNAPNLTIGGYGVNVGATVFCDKATRTMTVDETASSMQAMGPFGPVAGPYDAGQWVRYNVWARDVTASKWTPIYTWSSWSFIRSLTSTPYVERLSIPVHLGTNTVVGSAGHSYQVLVQVDWWTGKENVANITPTYTQTYKTDPYNTYYFNPSMCAF